MKTFPTIVTSIFIFLALVGVFIFATFSASNRNGIGAVVIWGSLPHDVFDTLIGKLAQGNDNYGAVTYQFIPEDKLVPQLVESIASGNGPDLVVFPEKNLVAQANKLEVISYASMSRREFENAFIQAGENFLSADGIYGIPFTVDPLVMYWNRTMFSEAGIAQPPRYWDEVSDIAPKLTKADKNGTLTQSAISFGTWENVSHAKEIVLTILGELGNPVIVPGDKGGYQSVFLSKTNSAALPSDSTLRFFTDFSDPSKPVYSWNRSVANSHDAFVTGKLAIYFGFASELNDIRAANPNLNFDVAPVPAIRGGGGGVYADVRALSIPRGAKNPSGALMVARVLSAQASQQTLIDSVGLPSVRRDISSGNAADPYTVVFRNAALSSFTFLDPDPTATNSIFQRMVESVSSGKLQISEATAAADQELKALVGTQ